MTAVPASSPESSRRLFLVLHPAFALTGICHSIPGPLLPSLSQTFDLNDSRSGFLLFAYYAGTSLGALLCGRNHTRALTLGFVALTVACLAVAAASPPLIYPLFLLLGICVGMPMTAVSMLVGRTLGTRSAAALTLLNFTWSAGALVAPLFAARLLISHSFRAAYLLLAGAAALAALACRLQLKDESAEPISRAARSKNLRLIAVFALLAFLQVGVENTTGSWLATYVLRTSGSGVALSAASSSLYWCGFLASRALSSLWLLRIPPARLLALAVSAAFAAALVLVSLSGTAAHVLGMVVLGASLAPIFPLLLASFFAQASDSSDSRWVLGICGLGGSVLPWLTGLISSHSGSLRLGLIIIPAGLLAIASMLPLIKPCRIATAPE